MDRHVLRVLAALFLIVLLEPAASAQVANGRTAPATAEVASQASFETSYLLALYMAQLAASGTPPSQADIDEATRQYLTNGAAVTGVPSSGPRAAYFQNGAAVMAYPASTRAASPGEASPRDAAAAAARGLEEEAGAPSAAASTQQTVPPGVTAPQAASTSEVEAGSVAGQGISPLDLQAALAIARQFAVPAASATAGVASAPSVPSPPVASGAAVPASAGTQVAEMPPSASAPAPTCPPGPSLASRAALALGGALFGGLAVALWSRPRRNLRRAVGGPR